MPRRFRHLSYANVVSSVALFAALSGSAYAALRLPANSVGTRQVRAHAITSAKLAPSATARLRGPRGYPGGQGLTSPQGLQGAAGPSDAFVARCFANNVSCTNNGDYSMFLDVGVPGGVYVLSGKATVTNADGAPVKASCSLLHGIPRSYGVLDQSDQTVAPSAKATLVTQAFETGTENESHSVRLECTVEPGPNKTPVVWSLAELTALRVGHVKEFLPAF